MLPVLRLSSPYRYIRAFSFSFFLIFLSNNQIKRDKYTHDARLMRLNTTLSLLLTPIKHDLLSHSPLSRMRQYIL
jgi:hypothetical protein